MFYYWNDFEKHRDPGRILIIYGAGVAGKHFINVNGIKPQYFYDQKNEIDVEDINGTRYPVYQLNSVPVPPNSDVIISLTRLEHLKEFMAGIDLFPEKCNLYFYPRFNFEKLEYRTNTEVPIINGKPAIYYNNVNRFSVSLHIMLSNGAVEELDLAKLAALFFRADSCFGLEYLQSFWDNTIAVSKNGYLTETKKDKPPSGFSESQRVGIESTVYLLGNCAFLSHWSYWEDSIEGLLSADKEWNYKIENYSHGSNSIDDIFIEMMNIEFEENSCVILNFEADISYGFLEKIVLTANRLKELNVRFVFLLHYNMLLKKHFGLFERFLIDKIYRDKSEMLRERESLIQKDLRFQKTMHGLGIECYTYPEKMYDEISDVFVDRKHVADLGNKYIAEFVKDIVLKKIQIPDMSREAALYSLKSYQTMLHSIHQQIDPHNTKCIGAVVMNCNPFTNGHRFLIEEALKHCDSLIIFVVSEDKSYFTFEERLKLVQRGVADLANVSIVPSGSFIISQFTFSDYFRKDNTQLLTVNCERDLEIFCTKIAPCCGIKIRFVGEEPMDMVTNYYNQTMKTILPKYGIKTLEIPRVSVDNTVISASTVRKALKSKDFDKISKLVPSTTLNFLREHYSHEPCESVFEDA